MASKKYKEYNEHLMLMNKARVLKANHWTLYEIAVELKIPITKVRELLMEAEWRNDTFELI